MLIIRGLNYLTVLNTDLRLSDPIRYEELSRKGIDWMAKAITDEPGIYLEGKFGVRIENTLIITPYKETEFGKFLQFESLTLCPIDKTPIITLKGV